jgi:redox-sensitive bicupin YhaK (pirin superfamily)
MLDYGAPEDFPPSDAPRGVGAHPHRGFETVTIVFEGEFEHRDSAGNSGRIGPGDVQWMTAGAGLLHEEFHSREQARRGGRVSLAQLWVNLPAAHKGTPPAYQEIGRADIPVVALDGGALRVIAGAYGEARGPARTFSAMQVWDVDLRPGANVALPVEAGDNAMIALLEGSIVVDGTEIGEPGLLSFAPEGDTIRVRAASDAKLLLLAGRPLDEPIAHYGPFVMNSEAEIRAAIDDFRRGRMGRMDAFA